MAERKAGRPSNKRQKIFNVYAILRCAMVDEDIQELLKINPGFRDMTPEDTDVNIQDAIYNMTEAMLAFQPPDLSRAEPLRR